LPSRAVGRFRADTIRWTMVYVKVFLIGFLENITTDTDLRPSGLRFEVDSLLFGLRPSGGDAGPFEHFACAWEDGFVGDGREVLPRRGVVRGGGLVLGSWWRWTRRWWVRTRVCGACATFTREKSVRQYLKEWRRRTGMWLVRVGRDKVSNEEFRSKTDGDSRIAGKRGVPKKLCYKGPM